MKYRILKCVALAAWAFLVGISLSASANAGSLHHGSTAQNAAVTGALPGQVLWTDYAAGQQRLCFDSAGEVCFPVRLGDNIIRLVNPNGAGNANLAGARPQTVCAMIYVFDDDEEMGECCGCPLSSTQLATYSVEHNLTSDWGLQGGPEGGAHGSGAIAIVAAAPNAPGCKTESGACHGGCDPTNVPGYSVTVANNLLGSRTLSKRRDQSSPSAVLEIPLNDDGGGDPTNIIYLQNQCGALVGNGSQGGICNCPIE